MQKVRAAVLAGAAAVTLILPTASRAADHRPPTGTPAADVFTALAVSVLAEPQEKIIVFSSFQGTLDYLAERLVVQGVSTIKMHGGVKTERSVLVDDFRLANGPTILLTSEVGGPGYGSVADPALWRDLHRSQAAVAGAGRGWDRGWLANRRLLVGAGVVLFAGLVLALVAKAAG